VKRHFLPNVGSVDRTELTDGATPVKGAVGAPPRGPPWEALAEGEEAGSTLWGGGQGGGKGGARGGGGGRTIKEKKTNNQGGEGQKFIAI
jgi:hypothetical protein